MFEKLDSNAQHKNVKACLHSFKRLVDSFGFTATFKTLYQSYQFH